MEWYAHIWYANNYITHLPWVELIYYNINHFSALILPF